jgi:hypothetical protein
LAEFFSENILWQGLGALDGNSSGRFFHLVPFIYYKNLIFLPVPFSVNIHSKWSVAVWISEPTAPKLCRVIIPMEGDRAVVFAKMILSSGFDQPTRLMLFEANRHTK